MLENIGKLLLRVMLAGMLLFHGVAKALHGIDFIKGRRVCLKFWLMGFMWVKFWHHCFSSWDGKVVFGQR